MLYPRANPHQPHGTAIHRHGVMQPYFLSASQSSYRSPRTTVLIPQSSSYHSHILPVSIPVLVPQSSYHSPRTTVLIPQSSYRSPHTTVLIPQSSYHSSQAIIATYCTTSAELASFPGFPTIQVLTTCGSANIGWWEGLGTRQVELHCCKIRSGQRPESFSKKLIECSFTGQFHLRLVSESDSILNHTSSISLHVHVTMQLLVF